MPIHKKFLSQGNQQILSNLLFESPPILSNPEHETTMEKKTAFQT